MANLNMIHVEVVYATAKAQCLIALTLEAGATVQVAIERSGVLELYPEINLQRQKVGIFSKPCQLTDRIKEGDRIEIYRPLLIDPKIERRKKAKIAAKRRKSLL